MHHAPAALRRTVLLIAIAIVATLAGGIICSAKPAHADTGAPAPVKLTCVAWEGGAATVNWDILVQLNPDGTAKSAEQQGDAYMNGVGIWAVQRTDPAEITISNGGRNLHFHGSALTQTTLFGSDFGINGVQNACSADFTFPDPQSPFINPEPYS